MENNDNTVEAVDTTGDVKEPLGFMLDEEMYIRWIELWRLDDALAVLTCRKDEKQQEFIELLREKFGISPEDDYEFVIHEDHVEVCKHTFSEPKPKLDNKIPANVINEEAKESEESNNE